MTGRKFRLRLISLFTAVFFSLSIFGAYAQEVTIPTTGSSGGALDISSLIKSNPEIMQLQGNVKTIESALTQIDQTAKPLYNRIVPSNMEAMTIAERIKAIVGNTKDLIGQGLGVYKSEVNNWNEAHGLTADSTFEQELGVGLNELGVQTGKMPLGGKGDVLIGKLRAFIEAIKDRLQSIIRVIRAKIAAVAQKIGLMKKSSEEKGASKDENGISKEEEGIEQYVDDSRQVQHADTFSAKLSKGVSEGVQNAKQSLKNSFSLSNIAVTATVAVGTNLAIDMIRGEKPSLKKAVKAVASLEFAGSVVGSALGAAGGQFTATLVKTFVPGPIGALVGAVIPVMFASATGQMGSSLAGDIKNGRFSISDAWKKIDKVDLVGSSIGSTIGMALGAPIPIIGPIIGGIVGGMLGSKVAKWIQSLFKGKTSVTSTPTSTQVTSSVYKGQEITVGNVANSVALSPSLSANGAGAASLVSGSGSAASAEELQEIEKKYYATYMEYNQLVKDGKHDEAKKIYNTLKEYSDRYNALRKNIQ